MDRENAVNFELPDHFCIHAVVYVSHIMPFTEQPNGIGQRVHLRPKPVPAVEAEEYIVENILKHRMG